MNALCLPPAMRFNARVAPQAMTAVPVERVEELARLAGFDRLRDFGVPEDELDEVAAPQPPRGPGALANPRPASPAEVAGAPLGRSGSRTGYRPARRAIPKEESRCRRIVC